MIDMMGGGTKQIRTYRICSIIASSGGGGGGGWVAHSE